MQPNTAAVVAGGGGTTEEAFSSLSRRRRRRRSSSNDPLILFLVGMMVTTGTVPFIYSHVHRTATTTETHSEKDAAGALGPTSLLLQRRHNTLPTFRKSPIRLRRAPPSQHMEKKDNVVLPTVGIQETTATTTLKTSTTTVAAATTTSDQKKHEPDTHIDDTTPILIWNNLHFQRREPCEIPCDYTTDQNRRKQADASVYERRGYQAPHPDDKFPIYLQMEGEHYYPIRLQGYKAENSYRWEESPLLKPYFEWIHYQPGTERYLQNPPVPFNSTINGASFVARNCHSRDQREKVVQYLMDYGHGFRVDSLSACLHNKDQPTPRPSKIALLQPYKFTLAFENGRVKDYVTEKVYEALASGVIPVYLGAPNIRNYVPDGSIINVDDFESNEALAQHLVACMRNETLYNSYHAWRFRPLPTWFVRKFNFTKVSTECRTCRYMHALKHGWEWDKEAQMGIAPQSTKALA